MCPDELTWMMYADGELDPARRREADVHVAGCGRCRALMASLRVEARVLADALQEEDVAAALVRTAAPGSEEVERASRASVAAAVGTLVACGGAAQWLIESVTLSSLVWLPSWMNPLQPDGRTNLFFNIAVYLAQEGTTIMATLMVAAEFLAIGVMALMALSLGGRVWMRRAFEGGLMLGLLGIAVPADAMEVRRAQATLVIPADQTVDDTLVAMADTVQVDGVVNGDLIAMARRVRVRGTVRGNLVTFSRDVEVDGTVEGSVLQLAQTVTSRAQVRGNLYAFGQTITLASAGSVGGNATTFSETATIEGSVGRDVTTFGRALDLGGTVSRRVNAYGEQVDVRAGARIDGSFTAHVRNRDNVRVAPGATVGGGTNIDVAEPAPSRYVTVRYYVSQCIRLAAAFLTGWILFWLVPRAARISLGSGGAVLTSAGLGAVAACATPILALVCAVTVVGLPLAALAVLSWFVLLYLAKILLALVLGRLVLGSSESRSTGVAAALLTGLVLVIVAINLPYVGLLVNLLLTITGLGLAVVELARWWRSARTGAPVNA